MENAVVGFKKVVKYVASMRRPYNASYTFTTLGEVMPEHRHAVALLDAMDVVDGYAVIKDVGEKIVSHFTQEVIYVVFSTQH